MKKRGSVITFTTLITIFAVAAIACYLVANFMFGSMLSVVELFEHNMEVIQGGFSLEFILLFAVPGATLLFGLVELIVDCVRKRVGTGIYLFLLSLILAASSFLMMGYIAAVEEPFGLFVYITEYIQYISTEYMVVAVVGSLTLAYLFFLINFIVDLATGKKKNDLYNNMYAYNPSPVGAPTAVAPSVEVNEPVAEVKVDENDPLAYASATEIEEEPEVVEEVAEVEPEIVEPKATKKTTTIKKDSVKKAATAKKADSKTSTVKKAAVAKASNKTTTIKKSEVEAASKKTTTIKKDDVKKASATTTIKKDDVKKATVTNEDGVTYGKAFHVSYREDLNKWQVKATGAQKALKTFNTQKEAYTFADQLAANQGASVRVHSKEGRIRKHVSTANKE